VKQARPVCKRADTTRWWGYRWSNGGTFQPVCSLGHDLDRSPAGTRKERWQAGLIQGGENAVV